MDKAGLLRFIMRSLGYSPTVVESEKIFKEKGNRTVYLKTDIKSDLLRFIGKKIDFATFLDILYDYSLKEPPAREVLCE